MCIVVLHVFHWRLGMLYIILSKILDTMARANWTRAMEASGDFANNQMIAGYSILSVGQ